MPFDYEEYKKELREQLQANGFNVDELNDDQIEMIMEPMEAPENYACDGEISPQQAREGWIRRLGEVGLNPKQIAQAVRFQLG